MASTYSDLKIELIGTGEQVGTWGTTTNTNLGTAIEEAITGSADVTFSSADVTLTLTNTNASQTARHLRLRLTGTSGGARNLTVPNIQKNYVIKNELADAVTVKNSTGATVTVPAGTSSYVFSTGAGVEEVISTSLFIPSGIITMWSGSIATIPATWALCDGGTYSGVTTPNLTDKFIVGAGSTYTPEDTGGNNSITLSTANLPAHTHTGSTNGNTTGISLTGQTKIPYWAGSDTDRGTLSSEYSIDNTVNIGLSDPGHSHSFTTNATGSGSSIDIRPLYFALAYIIKL